MADEGQRATRGRGTRGRGVASPPAQPSRCKQHELVLPGDYASFEAKIEKWIATCVMSRTEKNGKPVKREQALVRGNPSLASIWNAVGHLKGDKITIKAIYTWSPEATRVESIRFAAVVTMRTAPPAPKPPAPTLPPTPKPDDTVIDRPDDPQPPPPPPKDDDTKKPPDKPRIIIDPPPPWNPGRLNPRDAVEYAKKLLKYLESKQPDSDMVAQLTGAIAAASAAIAVVGSIVHLMEWDAAAGTIVAVGRWSDLDYATQRAWSRYDHLGKIDDVEHALRDLDRVLNEANKLDLDDEPPQIPPDKPAVTVQPFTRGEAVEHFHLGKLTNQGYTGLPNSFPGIDAVKGDYKTVTKGGQSIKVYKNPEAVSIKSTHVTDAKALARQFTNDYLPPLKGNFLEELSGVRVEGLGKKELHLIFEEGSLSGLRPSELKALEKTLKDMTAQAKKAKVTFKWFAFTSGAEESGPEFLKKLLLEEE